MSATTVSPVAPRADQEQPLPDQAASSPHAAGTGFAAGVASAVSLPRLSSAQKTDIQRWLDWQCEMIAGVHRGTVLVGVPDQPGGLDPVAFWPHNSKVTAVQLGLAQRAIQAGRGLIQKAFDEEDARQEVYDYVAYPLIDEGRAAAVALLAIEIRSEQQRQAVLQLLEWGATWLEKALNVDARHEFDVAELALRAIEPLTGDMPLAVSANRACTLLAEYLGCARVALGLVVGMQVRVEAVSHQVVFDKRVSDIGQLEAAMEECADQEQAICLPLAVGEVRGLNLAHSRLMEGGGVGAVCTAPLRIGEGTIGAMTFIWDADRPIDPAVIRKVAEIVRRLSPVIDLKRRESRSVRHRLSDAMRDTAAGLFGGAFLRAKLIVALLLAGLVASMLIQADRRVAARSLVEGTVQQAVVSPLAGYLSAAHVRAGDRVEAGQLMAELDDRELRLERERWVSERDKHAKEQQEALATRDRAKVSVTSARVAQAEAQLSLVDGQLERTRLRAPYAGTVVSGDLSRSLGAPLERGQMLFEVVPEGGYRVSLQVDEHDVAALQPGQTGRLRLTGLPADTIPFVITRVVPVATTELGANHFRVEAELTDPPDGLRPGMQGVAKVEVGRGSLLSVWTAELVARLRLWIWSAGL